jgi:Spy/CpxP family protein refolding chaperone
MRTIRPTRPMRWTCGAVLALLMLGNLASAACGGEAANGPPPTAPAGAQAATADDDTVAAELAEHHRHHHGGVAKFIEMSIDTLGVPPEQKAQIDKIQADLKARRAPVRDAERGLVASLADGIAAGTIDAAKVEAAITQVETTAAAAHEASVDALNQLHAALTPVQRAALIDKVQAHWAVWQEANLGEENAPGHEKKGHVAHLAEELGLTPDQVDKVRSSLHASAADVPHRLDPKEIDAHLNALASAFTSNTFDAKSLSTGQSASAHLAGAGAARMVHFYEAVVPVLTPEQRTKLAEHLREHQTHEDAT